MALNPIPGTVGYVAKRYSSQDERVIGKFTDTNHLYRLTRTGSPTEYDRGIINIWTQTTQNEANDFIDMINKTDPFYVDEDTFSWEIAETYQAPQIIEVPTTTLNNPSITAEDTFDLVYSSDYFQVNDVITSDMMHGDSLQVVSKGGKYGNGYLYTLKLTGEYVTSSTTIDRRFIQVGTKYDKKDNVVGEFDQRLSGLPGMGGKIKLYQSISAGYGVEHTITKWADHTTLRGANGKPLDLIGYDQYKVNEKSKVVYTGTMWEPFIERMMRDEMMKIRKNRMLYGSGGDMNTLGHRQENKKASVGIIPLMRQHGHYVPFNRGDFSLNLIRETFGDLFQGRVSMENRRVKLYTNEAGIKLFRQANKEDLLNSGFTIIADSRFIEGSGQNMTVNYGFGEAYTMETGRIEVAHLAELDKPRLNGNLGAGKYTPPIFIAFDISESEGGLKNIREVRIKGAPSMTWGYVNGRAHHLGFANSKGMDSANMFPGYQMWMEDRSDIFIEDFSKCVIFEELPQF